MKHGKAWRERFTPDEIRGLRVIRAHRAWLTLLEDACVADNYAQVLRVAVV